MAQRSPQELLSELRTYLMHFEQTGHLGETSTVAEIKRRLQERIGEVEAALGSDSPRKMPVSAPPTKEELRSGVAS